MVKVKKHPDVEYRCILGRHWVAVPVVGWHCGGRLTGRERGERQAAVVEGRCASKQVALQCCCAVLCCVLLCSVLMCSVVLCYTVLCFAVLCCGATPGRLLCCLVQQCCARLEAGCSPEFHSVAPAPLTWQVVRASPRDHHGRPGLEGLKQGGEGGGGQQRGGEVERA